MVNTGAAFVPLEGQAMRQVHVFVVDRQMTFLRLMERILDEAEYKVTAIPAGEEAHELIATTKPDIVVIDTWLQVRDDGWELMQTLRLDTRTQSIPVILASSDAESVKEKASEISGMRNVLLLPKPFDPAALLHAIERVTDPSSSWDTNAQAKLDTPSMELPLSG